MTTRRFLDTNILLYSISTAPDEAFKRDRSVEILEDGRCALSAQVLQEFYVQATRPSKPRRIEHDHAAQLMELWLRFEVHDLTPALIFSALAIKTRFKLSYWDAAIVAAAQAMQCDTLYSEDMSHGMKFGTLEIVNPFL